MKNILSIAAAVVVMAFAASASSEHVVDISGAGAQKFSVRIDVANQGSRAA